MRLISIGIVFTLAAVCFGDTITLKSGRVINGTYLGGTARQVRLDAGDRIETLDVSDISRIEFSSAPAQPAPAPAPEPRPVLRRSENVMNPDSAPAPAPAPRAAVSRGSVELPAGTNIVVRLIDGVDSESARPGQTFAASLDEPIMLGGDSIVPRGADATLKLVDAKDSGKLTGRAELTLDLQSIRVNGQMVDVNSQTISRESDSRGNRTAKVAGGTAAVGAIIGAIAGGGKGAAIGAVAGGAAGAGAEVVTKGQRVKIPSETRLTFVLDTPVRI